MLARMYLGTQPPFGGAGHALSKKYEVSMNHSIVKRVLAWVEACSSDPTRVTPPKLKVDRVTGTAQRRLTTTATSPAPSPPLLFSCTINQETMSVLHSSAEITGQDVSKIARSVPSPPLPRQTKRRRGDSRVDLSATDLTRAIDEACESRPTAELALLYLIDRYKFELPEIMNKLHDRGLDVCFSKVTFVSIAPLVGLDPDGFLRDAPTFIIERARIPSPLFKEIIGDMQVALKLYGPPQEHQNEEARSRFLAPLSNRIVAQFNLLIKSSPESIMPGRMATKGRVEYQFKVCGALTIVFIEVKLTLGTSTERLNAVAQVIAEADGCDFTNSRVDFHALIHAVLCDGEAFEFFTFDGSTRPPTFARGLIDPSIPSMVLRVPPFENSTPTAYIRGLRPVCECMHALFLSGYIDGLDAYYQRSVTRAAVSGRPRGSTPAWVVALGWARVAKEKAITAAELARGGDIGEANRVVSEASAALRESLEAAPPTFRREDCELMAGWNDECE